MTVPELVNLQRMKGKAKPYQIRQFLRLVEEYHLIWRGRMTDYHINIFYSEEDVCYVADIPDLKYCSAFGDTPQQALRQVQRAKEAWLTAAKELRKPIPKPRPNKWRRRHSKCRKPCSRRSSSRSRARKDSRPHNR